MKTSREDGDAAGCIYVRVERPVGPSSEAQHFENLMMPSIQHIRQFFDGKTSISKLGADREKLF